VGVQSWFRHLSAEIARSEESYSAEITRSEEAYSAEITRSEEAYPAWVSNRGLDTSVLRLLVQRRPTRLRLLVQKRPTRRGCPIVV